MAIRVVCPNGHTLKVKDSLAGKTGLCPVCGAQVKISPAPNAGLSEDDILSILGPHVPQPRPHFVPAEDTKPEPSESPGTSSADGPSPPNKTCDKCNREISAGTHICPHCHTYIAGLSDL